MQTFKHIYIIVLGCFCTLIFNACSKDEPNDEQREKFVKYYGGPYRNEVCNAVELNNELYILGSTTTSTSEITMTIIKTDDFGNTIWQKSFGGDSLSFEPAKIITTSDGCIAAVATRIDSISSNYFFVKINSVGETQIEREFEIDNQQTAQCLAELKNGNFLIGGISTNESGNDNQLTIIINKNGELVRQPVVRGTRMEQVNKIQQLANDTITIGVGATLDRETQKISTPLLMLFSEQQSAASASIFFSNLKGQFNDFVQISDNEIIACGTTSGGASVKGIIASINPQTYQLNWSKTYGATNTRFNGITICNDENILVVGASQTIAGDLDLIVLKLTVNGDVLLSKEVGYTSDEVGNSVFQAADNGFVIAATFDYETNSVMAVIKDEF